MSRSRTMHFATVYLSAKLFKSLRMYNKRFSSNLISGKVAHISQISLDKYCTAYCPKCASIVFPQKWSSGCVLSLRCSEEISQKTPALLDKGASCTPLTLLKRDSSTDPSSESFLKNCSGPLPLFSVCK